MPRRSIAWRSRSSTSDLRDQLLQPAPIEESTRAALPGFFIRQLG
jgi:hypothetical protein